MNATLTGNTYPLSFSGGPSLSGLSGELILLGNVTQADAGSDTAFATALQAALRTRSRTPVSFEARASNPVAVSAFERQPASRVT